MPASVCARVGKITPFFLRGRAPPTTLSRRQHNMLLQQYAAGAFALAHTHTVHIYSESTFACSLYSSPLSHSPNPSFQSATRAVCDADFIERVLSELLIIKQWRPTRANVRLLDFLNDPHRPFTSAGLVFRLRELKRSLQQLFRAFYLSLEYVDGEISIFC